MKFNTPTLVVAGVVGAALIWLVFLADRGSTVPDGIVYGNGQIEAVQVDIATKLSGRVAQVNAAEGDLVKRGDLVATIDATQLKAQLARAEAEVASAESAVAAAVASVAQAEAQLALTDKELERSSRLVERGVTSQEVYDTRLSNHTVAKANLAAAKATLVSRERTVDAARAVAREIETQIADTRLIAPTLGRVLYRLAEPGEVLGAGGKVLTLVNLEDIYMEFFLPAADAFRVQIGGEARIKLDIFDAAIPAKVSFVSPTAQFTPKQVETLSERDKLMFRVKVRVPPELVRRHIEHVKTGVRGVAYVRLNGDTDQPWPEFLNRLPPSVSEGGSTS